MDKQFHFKRDLFGYNTNEVDRYIDRLEEEIKQRKEEGELLRNDIDSIRCNVEQLKRSIEEQRMPVSQFAGEETPVPEYIEPGPELQDASMMLDLEGAQAKNEPKKKKGSKKVRILSDILFYSMIVAILICAFAFTQGSNSTATFFGYRYFNVLTSSMKSVYPPGTLIIVNTKEKDKVKVGDDITFYTDDTTTVTHRIVEIMEDYKGSGERGFRTKGVDQPAIDQEVRLEKNVVGPVVYSIKGIGKGLTFVADNMYFLLFIFVLLLVLSFVLRMIWGDDKAKQEEKRKKLEEKGNKKKLRKGVKA